MGIIAQIIEIILWDFLMLYQIFLSPQVKRSDSCMRFASRVAELRRTLRNYEKSRKFQNLLEL